MPTETVTLVLDKAQYERGISEVIAGQGRFSRSGERMGEGFLRGERAVTRATGRITSGLLQVQSVGDATAIALGGLERVFRIGLVPGVAAAVGIKAFEVFHEQIKKTNAAYKDLKDELEKPVVADSEVKKVDDRIETLTDKSKKLGDEVKSYGSKVAGFFLGLAGILGKVALPGILKGPIADALSRSAPVGPGAANQLIERASKQIDLLSQRREALFYQSLDRLSAAIQKTADKVQSPLRDLFHDIGSGQFSRDFFQKRSDDFITRNGQDVAAKLARFQEGGGQLSPLSQAMVDAARGAGAAGGFSLEDLVHSDFSNLDQLSKYDFTGLAPLSGMTLIVK